MTHHSWSATLLADDSDEMLLVWADFLEDAGDEAARGVRELLVGQGKRPERYDGLQLTCWWDATPSMLLAAGGGKCSLAGEIFRELTCDVKQHTYAGGAGVADYYHKTHGKADAYYRALYSAARAYVLAHPHSPQAATKSVTL